MVENECLIVSKLLTMRSTNNYIRCSIGMKRFDFVLTKYGYLAPVVSTVALTHSASVCQHCTCVRQHCKCY